MKPSKKFHKLSAISYQLLAFLFVFSIFYIPYSIFHPIAHADDVSDLKKQIDERNTNIAQLEKEIAEYQALADKTSSEAKTLQSAIATLQASQKKLDTSIKATEQKISAANLDIKKLGLQITDKEQKIIDQRNALAEALRRVQQNENASILVSLLSEQKISDIWNDIDNLLRFQNGIRDKVQELQGLKVDLLSDKSETEAEKSKLQTFESTLSDQKKVILYNQQQKNKLLTDTKSQEQTYQQIIADKQKQKAQFEAELFDAQSKLQFILDPKSLPAVGSLALSWPLDNIYITQLFGVTNASARLYVSGSHNGVDFRASVGTPVKAVADGKVEGAADTDLVCKGASFGRFVFIRHNNGLASTYGHLSVISVQEGQAVKRGQIIGYSGSTGYATGPHLHLSVYASAAVSMQNLPSKACGGRTYRLPIAATNGYLDPMLYLPKYSGPTQ